MDKKKIKEYAITEYQRWAEAAAELGDRQLCAELSALEGEEDELIDAFCGDLRFGTSGIRGVIGPGTNRMNEYVVRRTTQGVANYLNKNHESPSVVIAYDTRKKSRAFAEETAKVLRGNGIQVYLFHELATVSLLSYAIRELGCTMGIMITASHNPKIFNGYKVYNSDGYQIVGSAPKDILDEIDKLDFFDGIASSEDKIRPVPKEIAGRFISDIIAMCPQRPEDTNLSLIYTPLNGTGNRYVRAVLSGAGFRRVTVVSCQESPDENFTTCPAPNPEKITAYSEAFRTLDRIKGDIIIATDPDCDRVGVCIYHNDMKVLLTGNQLGVLLLDYLCQISPPKPGQIMVKSIVTTPLAQWVAEKHGLRVINTLTGFKYIGEIITELEKANRTDEYYFAFEESNGYLIDPFIRDKDGVSAAMLTACMAAFHKARGLDLIDRLQQIYRETGVCIDKTRNYFFEGPYGKASMDQVMEFFRKEVSDSLGGRKIAEKTDFMGKTGLPRSNVISFVLENGTQCIIRPSGTEAKIKVYFFETESSSELEGEIRDIIESFKEGL